MNIMANNIDISDEYAIMKYYTDYDEIESDKHISNVYSLLYKYIEQYNSIIVSYNKLRIMSKNDKYKRLSKIKSIPCLSFNTFDIVVACIDMIDNNIKNHKTIKKLNGRINKMRRHIKNKYKYDS